MTLCLFHIPFILSMIIKIEKIRDFTIYCNDFRLECEKFNTFNI